MRRRAVRRAGRPGFHSVTPRLVAVDAGALVEFLRAVFGASGELHGDRPAEIRIGDSPVMVTTAGAREAFSGFLHVYVDDDETYRRAVAAGAETLEAPLDTPYGDRRAMVKDRWGNVWQLAQPSSSAPSGLRLGLQRLPDIRPELRRVTVTVNVHRVKHGGADHLVLLTGDGQRALRLAGHVPAIHHLPAHCSTSSSSSENASTN